MAGVRISLALLLAGAPAVAQPADLPIAPAKTLELPTGVKTMKAGEGMVYATKRGQVLYGMDMRTLMRWTADPSQYCVGQCLETWEPVLAPAGSEANIRFPVGFGEQAPDPKMVQPQAAPDWTIIAGPQGPQWVYKGWHMVFTRRGEKAGATEHDGDGYYSWNTLKFVPPVPKVAAPPGISPVFVKGEYVLAAADGALLFTGKCKGRCDWEPLPAGMASAGLADWQVQESGDSPQWAFRKKAVFVSREEDAVPLGGTALRAASASPQGRDGK